MNIRIRLGTPSPQKTQIKLPKMNNWNQDLSHSDKK